MRSGFWSLIDIVILDLNPGMRSQTQNFWLNLRKHWTMKGSSLVSGGIDLICMYVWFMVKISGMLFSHVFIRRWCMLEHL
jgi:hypothetical protein